MLLTGRLLSRHFKSGEPLTVLDIGSGEGRLWSRLDINIRSRCEITGLDADPDWREPDRSFHYLDHVVHGFAPDALESIGSGSFDVVTAFDLIEHMDRRSGYHLLYEMERIARERCIVFTPNGFVWQPPAPRNPFNAHVSGWTASDFFDFGWSKVYGCIGIRVNYGPYAMRRRGEPGAIGRLPLRALDVLVQPVPRAAFAILATTTRLPRWRPEGC